MANPNSVAGFENQPSTCRSCRRDSFAGRPLPWRAAKAAGLRRQNVFIQPQTVLGATPKAAAASNCERPDLTKVTAARRRRTCSARVIRIVVLMH